MSRMMLRWRLRREIRRLRRRSCLTTRQGRRQFLRRVYKMAMHAFAHGEVRRYA